jgi:hypothetical protein
MRGKAAERELAAGKRKLSVLTLEIDEIELNDAFLQDIDTDDGLLGEAECRHRYVIIDIVGTEKQLNFAKWFLQYN